MKKKLHCISKRELVYTLIHSGLIEQLEKEVDISHIFDKVESD